MSSVAFDLIESLPRLVFLENGAINLSFSIPMIEMMQIHQSLQKPFIRNPWDEPFKAEVFYREFPF